MKALLKGFDCNHIATIPDAEEFPAVIIFGGRAFYGTSTKDNGRVGVYQECSAVTIHFLDHETPIEVRVKLERSDVCGWRVAYGSRVIAQGNRVYCKQQASQFCRENGIDSWWHQKKGIKGHPGKWTQIQVFAERSTASELMKRLHSAARVAMSKNL